MLEVSGNPAEEINRLQREIEDLKADLKYYQDKNSYSVARATESNLLDKVNDGTLLDTENHDHVREFLSDVAYDYDYVHEDYAHDDCISDDRWSELYNKCEEAHSTLARMIDHCTDDDCDCTTKQEFADCIEEAYSDLSGFDYL